MELIKKAGQHFRTHRVKERCCALHRARIATTFCHSVNDIIDHAKLCLPVRESPPACPGQTSTQGDHLSGESECQSSLTLSMYTAMNPCVVVCPVRPCPEPPSCAADQPRPSQRLMFVLTRHAIELFRRLKSILRLISWAQPCHDRLCPRSLWWWWWHGLIGSGSQLRWHAGCVIIPIVCAMFICGCPCAHASKLVPVGSMPMPGICSIMFVGCMPIGPVMGGIMPNGCVGVPTIMLPGGMPLIMPPGDMMPPAVCMPCCCGAASHPEVPCPAALRPSAASP